MPKISVIVPVYKVEAYLRRCVDSILAQTFQDFELILVDDGSPDNCPAICDEYAAKDSRVRVIHQKNGGLSAARNAGIDWVFAHSDSQYLTFIDSDDWVSKHYLQYLKQAVEETGCLMSACAYQRTEGEALPGEEACVIHKRSADDFYCGSTDGVSPMIACAKLYAKSLFQCLRYPLGKLHEDEFTTYRTVYQAGAVAVCPVKLYAYYTNPESIMHTTWSPQRLDGVEGYEQQIAFARQNENQRLLCRSLRMCACLLAKQLVQMRELAKQNGCDYSAYEKLAKKKLQSALKQGKKVSLFQEEKDRWLYYIAYPTKMLWADRLNKVLGRK